MPQTLTGQRVLIIGGAKYLGAAVARAASSDGAHVIIGARDLAKADTLAAELRDAETIHFDVADEESIRMAAQSLGAVDHIVVTASAHHNVPVAELEHDGILGAFEAKIIGPMLVAKHFAPLIPPTGSFLLFSGTAAWNPSPGLTVMGVTNGAVAFLASHLAKELRADPGQRDLSRHHRFRHLGWPRRGIEAGPVRRRRGGQPRWSRRHAGGHRGCGDLAAR